jgi:hypothetical protein
MIFTILGDYSNDKMPLSISFEYLPFNVLEKLIINSDYNGGTFDKTPSLNNK